MSPVVAASYSLVCRSPVWMSATPAANISWRPAVAAFPASATVKCRRPPLSAARVLPEKQRPAFSIPPTALMYPSLPLDVKDRWDIKEEKDHVKLWFQVPGLSKEDLEITASEDILEIKKKGATRTGGGDDEPVADVHGVGSFHVKLLMTKEYDSSNITAELKAGMLEVTVGKSKSRKVNEVGFGPRSPAKPDTSPAFSIPPTALMYPSLPPDAKGRWDIKEEKDHIKLWFQVPGLLEEDLEITTGEDMLEIKRKVATRTRGGGSDDEPVADVHGVGSFHVKLLMTKEYDSRNITAELKAGMLEVTVGKSKSRKVNEVGFGPRSPAKPDTSPAFSIPPTTLMYPSLPPDVKERWDIKEEKDHVKLCFQVPGLSEEDLEITTSEDMLEIKMKGATRTGGSGDNDEPVADVHGLVSLHIKLLMTKEYDSSNITAELKAGMLEVTVGKTNSHKVNEVGFAPRSPAKPDMSPSFSIAPTGKLIPLTSSGF